MQAIEFEGYMENGAIAVPRQYLNTITNPVRVIVLSNERGQSDPYQGNKRLYSLDIDMTGFVFNREEINDR